MWLYFDRNGRLLEALMHGPQPRSGTTDFEIFAYFEGKDIIEDYTTAELRLVRPDLNESEQPVPYMTAVTGLRFEAFDDERPIKFEDGKSYDVYRFDFTEDMTDDDGTVTMVLNMSGQWKAHITLSSIRGRNSVQGEVTFSVGSGSVESEDPVTIPNSVMFTHIESELSRKASHEYVTHAVSNEQLRAQTAENNIRTETSNAIAGLDERLSGLISDEQRRAEDVEASLVKSSDFEAYRGLNSEILDNINRDLNGKVSQREGYDLISTQELKRLAGISNYDDTNLQTAMSNLSMEMLNAQKAFHYVKVSHQAAKGNWDYQFMFPSSIKTSFQKLFDVANHLKEAAPTIVIPATGTYYDTEANKNYMVVSVRPSPTDMMMAVAMVEASNGTLREIETGMIDIIDTVVL